ncbi:hypothetical protein B6S12_02525 [Helicobacter valdiviensis]|uniref:Periplasmic protein n=1 Tax=Helicobacter valdiviensis TaxID=1458358 RepID=A0A2W6MWF5_9HELI|nr:hypothetical protein [Helicobacter valdiviensis]PZT48737.1 hypothetical protein B6S12_02525 [Helicobacter valdiviensis]
MVKKLFLILFCSGIVFANSVTYSIISILGPQEFQRNERFINKVFAKEENFLNGKGEPNLYKISQALKANGLLSLTFGVPKELLVEFEIKENPLVFMNALYEVLRAMGYYYYLIKESQIDEKGYRFILSMNTEYAIDPVILQEKLKEYGYEANLIERKSLQEWKYSFKNVEFKYPKATQLLLNESKFMANLAGEYWYQCEGGNKLILESANGAKWFPKIVFFDKFMNIIEVEETKESVQKLEVTLPKEVKFIKVSDTFLPINIKNGLNVIMQ